MSYILKIRHLLWCINHRINCIDEGQLPLNTTADREISLLIWFSVTYWLTEWREYLFLNSFIQTKYLLAQIKIIINSYSLMK